MTTFVVNAARFWNAAAAHELCPSDFVVGDVCGQTGVRSCQKEWTLNDVSWDCAHAKTCFEMSE